MCISKSLSKLSVFYACMLLTFSFFSTLFIQSYTSPIEDSVLEEGLFTENTFVLFVTASYIGATISCLFVGLISEWLGIKSTIILFSPLNIFGSVLLLVAYDSISMIFGRFLIGLYLGIPMSLVPVYISEIVSSDMKKFYGAILSLAVSAGILLSYTLGIWLGYRWLVCIYLMMTVFMIVNLVFLPESPIWLRNKGWIYKANQASKYFNGLGITEYVCDLNTESCQHESVCLIDNRVSLRDRISQYFTWPIIRPLLICTSIQVYSVVCGYMLLVSYSAHILEKGLNMNPNIVICFFPLFQLIGSTLFIYIIQKVNWKKLLLVTTFVQMISLGLLGLSFYLSIHVFHCTHSGVETVLCKLLQSSPLLFVAIFALGFSMGWGSLSWWLYGQILQEHYINVSAGIVTLFAYIAECFNQLIAPILVEYWGSDVVFFLCSLVCLSALPLQYYY